MRALVLASLLALAAATAPAAAQGTSEQRAHCESDAWKFCDQYVPDAAAVEHCLRGHMRQLSPGCRREFGGGRRR